MIKPKALRPGDTVGIVAPSDAVLSIDVERGIKILESWGLKTKLGKHIYEVKEDFMAGTGEQRREDMLEMLNDPEVSMIWGATGGYAATEVLPVFNRQTIQSLQSSPKWFMGYSDMCLVLNVLTSFGIVSVMGPNLAGLAEWDKVTGEEIRKMLFGEKVPGIGPEFKWSPGIEGRAEGRLVASNLEALIFSFGTRFDPIMYGRGDIILALEELDIEKSTLQRQLDIILGHKRSNRIKGLVVGRLINIGEFSYPKWGQLVTSRELITRKVKGFGVPLAFCQDFGHAEWDSDNWLDRVRYRKKNRRFLSLPSGIMSRLTVGEGECMLEYTENICESVLPLVSP